MSGSSETRHAGTEVSAAPCEYPVPYRPISCQLYTRALLIATPELAREKLISFVEPLEKIRDRAAHCMVDLDDPYKIRTSD